ncbi:MAG: DUF3108 domain-containing protein [Marinomonas foliarum]|jgi:hypothetical protein|uniref:DUF3108 domain-containing protein n=1 Tax=Marinomonas foliarum TaxID=491950 RepID=A0A368ZY00_9GAMM|nr:DUF3108 domain-containing protein [Marinomonas foliarum]QRV23611.1 DUF3108 domain-containing protein [Marinomonas foliarum]RCX01148.1 uncharacterized protein DUF3108 [Marinomonas foliarum]
MRARKIPMLLMAIFMSIPMLSFSSTTEITPPPIETFLKPYSAVYSTVWKKGISLKVEGKQTLIKQDNNSWKFTFTADSLIASLNESSVFKVKDQQIVPTKYQYKSSALGKKRSATLTFDWENNLVRNDVKNKPWNLSISPGTLDKLSIQLQVRQDLKLGKSDFDYQIADGGYIKSWSFKRDKMETVNTNLGRLSAIKIIRTDNLEKGKKTSFWFAPSLDYLLVKLEHQEDGESYHLDIESLK